MAKKKGIKTKLADFPEEVTEDGLIMYGETSYENQMAVLSHFLHNHPKDLNKEQKEESDRAFIILKNAA